MKQILLNIVFFNKYNKTTLVSINLLLFRLLFIFLLFLILLTNIGDIDGVFSVFGVVDVSAVDYLYFYDYCFLLSNIADID